MNGSKLSIAMLQVPVSSSIKENIEWVRAHSSNSCDVLVLPEIWNCPYQNEEMKGAIDSQDDCIALIKELSIQNSQVVIGGSIPYFKDGKIYNTCFVYNQGACIAQYAKTHLMSFCGHTNYSEADVFAPGSSFTTFQIHGIQVGLLLCYDIRFCQPANLLTQKRIQCLFLPAAFNSKARQKHWKILLRTRALENQIFVCGVNPSYQYKKYNCDGHSMIVNPDGKILYEMNEENKLACFEIDLDEIQKIRKRMPYANIRRDDLYEIKEKKHETNINQ